jgi:WD40 repeat protein
VFVLRDPLAPTLASCRLLLFESRFFHATTIRLSRLTRIEGFVGRLPKSQVAHELKGQTEGSVASITFSASGKKLAALTHRRKETGVRITPTLQEHDLETGRATLLETKEYEYICAISFIGNGSKVGVIGALRSDTKRTVESQSHISFWDGRGGLRMVARHKQQTSRRSVSDQIDNFPVGCAVDSKTSAEINQRGEVVLTNSEDPEELEILEISRSQGVSFYSESIFLQGKAARIVTMTTSRQLVVWDLATKGRLIALTYNPSEFATSSDGKVLALIENGKLCCWAAKNGRRN